MNWTNIWMSIFGTTDFLGVNLGFWIAMAIVLLIVVAMNVIFWCIKPKKNSKRNMADRHSIQ